MEVKFCSYLDGIIERTMSEDELCAFSLYYPKSSKLAIGIDPSKSGWAMSIINAYTEEFLYSIEINGVGAEKSIDEVRDSVKRVVKILVEPIKEKVVRAVTEMVIQADKKNGFHTNIQLNEVRSFTKFLFEETLGRGILKERNNWAWKNAILPTELRKKAIHKGSVPFISEKLGISFSSDNITDSLCIAIYAAREYQNSFERLIPNSIVEVDKTDIPYMLVNSTEILSKIRNTFEYDYNYNLATNIESISKTYPGMPLACRVLLDKLSYKEIVESGVAFLSERQVVYDNIVLVLGLEKGAKNS